MNTKTSPLAVRTKIGNAIQAGKLPRASTQQCKICRGPASDWHHPDYSKPFDVIPLCRRCHLDVHRSVKYRKSNREKVGIQVVTVHINKVQKQELINKARSDGLTTSAAMRILIKHYTENGLPVQEPTS